jgi:hypothetical protein
MCIVDPAACRHAGDESRGSAKLLDGDRARLYLLSRNPMLRGCRFVGKAQTLGIASRKRLRSAPI